MNKIYFIGIVLFIISLLFLITKKSLEYFNESPLNSCDAIMYINLENRGDRKDLLLKDFEEIGINKNKIHKISAVHIPNNGHKGCIQSHLIALRMAKMNDWKMVCIFEDDAEIIDKNNFNNTIENILNELNDQNWDLLNLSCANKKSESISNKKYIDKLLHATTSACYIIKSHYYNKLINLFEYCNQMMIPEKWGAVSDKDNWEPYALDQKWNELVKKDNWYCPKENLIKQRNIKSSINSRENFSYNDIELSPKLSNYDILNLKNGQKKMSIMLKEFDKICRKHNIRYFLVGGSLLGALLYKGWIPWDGDVDLEIYYDDYEKFKEIIQKELPNNLWYQTNDTDSLYPKNSPIIGKIRDLNSCYIEYSNSGGTQWHNGLQIDINILKIENNKIMFSDNENNNHINADEIFPLREVPFEDFNVFIMNKSEKYLTNKYGKKWTEILPVNKRYPHEGKIDPYNPCEHHYELYPELYNNENFNNNKVNKDDIV